MVGTAQSRRHPDCREDRGSATAVWRCSAGWGASGVARDAVGPGRREWVMRPDSSTRSRERLTNWGLRGLLLTM